MQTNLMYIYRQAYCYSLRVAKIEPNTKILLFQSTALGACNEKEEWIEETTEASAEDFLTKKSDLEKQVEFLTNKVNSPGMFVHR